MSPNTMFEIGLNPFQIAVYAYLTRCSNNSDAFPAYATIATKTGMGATKAKEVVKELESLGLLRKERRFREDGGNHSNMYRVIYPGTPDDLNGSRNTDNPGTPDDLNGSRNTDNPGTPDDQYKELSYKELFEEELIDKEKDIIYTQFEEFWLFYPKKVGKKDALRHFERLNKDKKFSFADFVSGTKNYVDHCNQNNRFLKDASAFVNQETYKDFLEMPAESINGKAYSKGTKNQSKTARNEELLDQMMGGIAKDDGRRNQRIIIDDQFDLS